MMALIALSNIEKNYLIGSTIVPVLQSVNLSITKGEYVALMGASGSGKSTLMNIIGCLDRPSAGEYFLDGSEVSQASADTRASIRNKKIGFVFQNFNLLRRTSALENVALPLEYSTKEIPKSESLKRATEMLNRVGLGDRLKHDPSELSGGQQQRVAIARALVNEPEVLLADEPTGNLDSRTSNEILGLFAELHQNAGVTIILVTHEADVAQHAQRTVRIHDGTVITDST
jgi:ABC-type lipoprotein export system ATPase subunit